MLYVTSLNDKFVCAAFQPL